MSDSYWLQNCDVTGTIIKTRGDDRILNGQTESSFYYSLSIQVDPCILSQDPRTYVSMGAYVYIPCV